MSDTLSMESPFHARLKASSGRMLWLGLALTLLGIAAIVFPMISTLVTALFVGWVFLCSGVLLFVGAFSMHGTGPFFGALLSSLASIAAGVILLFNPLAGALALTIVMVVLLMIEGAFEVVFAFEMRPHPSWTWMLLAGLASIAVSVVIASGLPGISTVVLGILLGINFLSTGIGFLVLSRLMRA